MLNAKKTLLFLACGVYKPSKNKVFGSGGILSILLFSGSINERVLFLFIYFFFCVCLFCRLASGSMHAEINGEFVLNKVFDYSYTYRICPYPSAPTIILVNLSYQ